MGHVMNVSRFGLFLYSYLAAGKAVEGECMSLSTRLQC